MPRMAGGLSMVSFRLLILIAMTAAGFAAPIADGQPPSSRPPGAEAMVDDYRWWIDGRLVKPNQKEIDPKLLKELMEKLPKEKQDQEQIKEWLKNNPEF